MSKMSEIGITLMEFYEALNAYGHADPLVVELKRSLLLTGMEDVKTMVEGIELDAAAVALGEDGANLGNGDIPV